MGKLFYPVRELFRPEETNGTLAHDGQVAQQVHRAKMTADANEFGTDLLRLFNEQEVDYVRQTGPGRYEPVLLPKSATHQLLATGWNVHKKKRVAVHVGLALSVVARPLKPKLLRTSLTVRKCIPKDSPVYRLVGPLQGKRGVLRWLLEATRAKDKLHPIKLRDVAHLDDDACDNLYTRIRRASLQRKFAD